MQDSKNKASRNPKTQKERRRDLRKNATPAEARLWSLLRNRQMAGRKFRRQHGIGPYIVDFFCPEESLAVELDGQVHEGPIAARLDFERSEFLRKEGIQVLRFENRIVFENSEWLLDQIQGEFRKCG